MEYLGRKDRLRPEQVMNLIAKMCRDTEFSGLARNFWVYTRFYELLARGAGARFYPSGCGGHKNLENVATFYKFLGGRKNLAPAPNPPRASPHGFGLIPELCV